MAAKPQRQELTERVTLRMTPLLRNRVRAYMHAEGISDEPEALRALLRSALDAARRAPLGTTEPDHHGHAQPLARHPSPPA